MCSLVISVYSVNFSFGYDFVYMYLGISENMYSIFYPPPPIWGLHVTMIKLVLLQSFQR